MKTRKIKGKHFIFDLYGCDYHELNNVKTLERLLLDAAKAAHMEILGHRFHSFKPQGVTGFVLLSTSHISVHTWPEYGYAAFDVFSCSDERQTKLAVDYIAKRIRFKRKKMRGIDRGYAELKTINIPIYRDNTKRQVKVHRKLAEIQSPFQNIQVLELERFGKTLLIDGITQVSESDTALYDKAITRPLKSSDRNVLVLGGGDGFVARHIVQKNPKARVTVVELDPDVVYCAKEHFGQEKTFTHKRVNLIIGDALQFLKTAARKGLAYDGIVIDLTDEPVGSGKALTKLKSFYEQLLTLALPVLRAEGWISSQAGVPRVQRPHISTYEVLKPLFESHLGNVRQKEILIPSFLEKNIFLFGKNRKKRRP